LICRGSEARLLEADFARFLSLDNLVPLECFKQLSSSIKVLALTRLDGSCFLIAIA